MTMMITTRTKKMMIRVMVMVSSKRKAHSTGREQQIDSLIRKCSLKPKLRGTSYILSFQCWFLNRSMLLHSRWGCLKVHTAFVPRETHNISCGSRFSVISVLYSSCFLAIHLLAIYLFKFFLNHSSCFGEQIGHGGLGIFLLLMCRGSINWRNTRENVVLMGDEMEGRCYETVSCKPL